MFAFWAGQQVARSDRRPATSTCSALPEAGPERGPPECEDLQVFCCIVAGNTQSLAARLQLPDGASDAIGTMLLPLGVLVGRAACVFVRPKHYFPGN